MIRYLQCSLFFLVLALGVQGSPLEDILKAYVGRWEGHFTIHSAATGYSETFPVAQDYWMEDGQLRGLAVSERQSGLESARSITYISEDKLVSEITQKNVTETYIGVLHEGGVVWLPSNTKRANDYQLKESFTRVGGVRVLKTDGFDTYVYQEGLAHIVFKGELFLQKKAKK